jgi:site-specific recombinase XerD
MNIHFYLDRNKIRSSEKTIQCFVRGLEKGKTIVLNTGRKIDPESWDKVKEEALYKGKNKSGLAREINNFLTDLKLKIERTEIKLREENPDVDFDTLKTSITSLVSGNKKSKLSFFESLDLFIKLRDNELSPNSLRKFTTLKKLLNNFETLSRKNISFSKIDQLFYDEFLNYLWDVRKHTNNSAYKIIGLLKIFLKWAFDRDLNRYRYFEKFKIKEDKTDIVTLDEEELDNLFNYDFSHDKRHDKVRDLFLFGCYTGGRFTDLTKITREDIRDGKWYLRVNKTRDILEIPLIDNALSILKKYEAETYPLPRLSNQKLNKYIKEVCKQAEIKGNVTVTKYRGATPIKVSKPKYDLISSHTARRTFITESLRRGMRAEVVMRISGHRSYRTFQKYIDVAQHDKTDEMNRAWNRPPLRVLNVRKAQ